MAQPLRSIHWTENIYIIVRQFCHCFHNYLKFFHAGNIFNNVHLWLFNCNVSKEMEKQISRFAMTRGLSEPGAGGEMAGDEGPMPDLDDPRMARAMAEMEREMEHMDENNPKHMAHLMRKMKDLMPPGSMPKELDVAIKRLEAGEDPEKIEADMGDVFGDMMGPEGEGEDTGFSGAYSRDGGLYDY